MQHFPSIRSLNPVSSCDEICQKHLKKLICECSRGLSFFGFRLHRSSEHIVLVSPASSPFIGKNGNVLQLQNYEEPAKSGNMPVHSLFERNNLCSNRCVHKILHFQTYNVDRQGADSAGTATAFLSGVKTNTGVLGVNEHVKRGDCSNVEGNKLKSILHYSNEEGEQNMEHFPMQISLFYT